MMEWAETSLNVLQMQTADLGKVRGNRVRKRDKVRAHG